MPCTWRLIEHCSHAYLRSEGSPHLCMHSGAVMGSRRMPWHRSHARHSAMPRKDLCTTSPSPMSLPEGPGPSSIAMRLCLQERRAEVAVLTHDSLQKENVAGRGMSVQHAWKRVNKECRIKEGFTNLVLRQVFSTLPHATACMPAQGKASSMTSCHGNVGQSRDAADERIYTSRNK